MESPYKFLDFYNFDDQNIFFGRESETNILIADVVVSRLVVLFARTGTGKTSLINAGVRPILEAKKFRTFYIRVEKDPTEAARDVLIRENLLKDGGEAISFSEQLSSVVKSLKRPIVLFFDQFEEFFIQIEDREKRRQFISNISEVYRNAESGVHIVFSMRQEYFHEMDEFRSEIPSIFHQSSNLKLRPLDEDQARIAITKPAAFLDAEFEPILVDEIIKDLKMEKGSIRPPSLQIICDTLWRSKSNAENIITLKEYNDLGRAENILDSRLTQDIELALADKDTKLVSLMQGLIPELQTGEGTKYPRVFSDLITTLKTDDESLRKLTEGLKKVQIIRETFISEAPAIEWASDYLAERTESLLGIAKAIELKRVLNIAIGKVALSPKSLDDGQLVDDIQSSYLTDGVYITEEEFEQFSQTIMYLKNLRADEIGLLFDTALYYQSNMKLWFERVPKAKTNGLKLLGKKIHDKDANLNLRKGAIILLSELGSDQALALLENALALDDPELSKEAMDGLIRVPGEKASRLLAKSLERDDLWESLVGALTRAGTERSVKLLRPLLLQEDKFFQALYALERLAKSSRQAEGSAEKALESTIPKLEELLKNDSTSKSAESALERLTKFRDPLGSIARKALIVPAKKVEEPSVRTGLHKRLERNKLDFLAPSESAISSIENIENMMPLINKGRVIPVISNSIRTDQIFRERMTPLDGSEYTNEDQTINEQLARDWAKAIKYPLEDNHNLARVAQYYSVDQEDSLLAKAKYIDFLKEILLKFSEKDEVYYEQANALKREIKDISFSEVVRQLDYPRLPQGMEDPLRLLAKLPLPVFVTTSYFDFMERALLNENKRPRTQMIFWSGGISRAKTEHLPDPDFEPSVANPVVFHLYGLEDYPQTLVLSEDDFMNFLISIAEDVNTQNPVVPLRLRQEFAESTLLLLGYAAQDWDFRVLFRFISKFRKANEFAPKGLMPQLKPIVKQKESIEKSMEYLTRYFGRIRLSVEWTSTENFIQTLWNEWEKYRTR